MSRVLQSSSVTHGSKVRCESILLSGLCRRERIKPHSWEWGRELLCSPLQRACCRALLNKDGRDELIALYAVMRWVDSQCQWQPKCAGGMGITKYMGISLWAFPSEQTCQRARASAQTAWQHTANASGLSKESEALESTEFSFYKLFSELRPTFYPVCLWSHVSWKKADVSVHH